MTGLLQSTAFKNIIINRTPLIDVRAPVEFEKGAFPHAVNLPIMNDEERHLIGLKYKQEGNVEAVKLGEKLVSGEILKSRVKAWLDFMTQNPKAMLYCFRGGQRSEISQMLLAGEQKNIVRLKGGYKAFRNYLMHVIEDAPTHFNPLILGGRTGSGKTILLHKIQNVIDLEGLADHRGSSFGRKITKQPTQINFENTLAYALIQKIDLGFKTLIFEDEGAFIGSVYIPGTFANYLNEAPLVILETPIEERIKITFDEYIVKGQESYADAFGEDYLQLWIQDTQDAMKRIKKRLGGLRYVRLCEIFDTAVATQAASGSLDAYKELITYLLNEYYDPMYDYQIKKNASKIVFRGSSAEIERYFNSLKENA